MVNGFHDEQHQGVPGWLPRQDLPLLGAQSPPELMLPLLSFAWRRRIRIVTSFCYSCVLSASNAARA